ncbi:MAG: hypothetical protein PF961_21480 [Planctomycetota bacterium]|jgi:vacuolar-type H+-ATPase subunit I/STV1|nr:hypothetical protein [Planctomycetota bacterium]
MTQHNKSDPFAPPAQDQASEQSVRFREHGAVGILIVLLAPWVMFGVYAASGTALAAYVVGLVFGLLAFHHGHHAARTGRGAQRRYGRYARLMALGLVLASLVLVLR